MASREGEKKCNYKVIVGLPLVHEHSSCFLLRRGAYDMVLRLVHTAVVKIRWAVYTCGSYLQEQGGGEC